MKRNLEDDEEKNGTEIHRSDSVNYTSNNLQISPKKIRLEIQKKPMKPDTSGQEQSKKSKTIFPYGNYSRYYGYRNKINDVFTDVRLDVMKEHRELFEYKEVLDIGCNVGNVTMAIAKDFNVKSIIGLDIDNKLINKAKAILTKTDRTGEAINLSSRVSFQCANYVLKNETLLSLESPRFDLILCLSVTKWIHLNNGDEGLKLAFKRMFHQLRPGGRLILEPQAWKTYQRRKNLTQLIRSNYESIKFRPNEFKNYLLSEEVGFIEAYNLEVPAHLVKGFQRPIEIYVKNI